ncbi:MAG: DUF6600 domain-containing protein, partial [Verrucomicrobiota bacterium]
MNTTWYLHSHVVCLRVSYVCMVCPFVNFERFTKHRLQDDSRSCQTSGVLQQSWRISQGIKAAADFYTPLETQGSWIEVESYGRCWRPAGVAVEWQPYTAGHWVWTDV